MDSKTKIGLDPEKSEKLANNLSDLLANYSVFYQNARGYHWNIKGDKFFELHLKFEELYTDLLTKIDELAERILTLGYSPDHKYSWYLEISEIEESKETTNGMNSVTEILEAFVIILTKQRLILDLSDDANDEGTNALMSDYIREQEKLVWMYSAFLNS